LARKYLTASGKTYQTMSHHVTFALPVDCLSPVCTEPV